MRPLAFVAVMLVALSAGAFVGCTAVDEDPDVLECEADGAEDRFACVMENGCASPWILGVAISECEDEFGEDAAECADEYAASDKATADTYACLESCASNGNAPHTEAGLAALWCQRLDDPDFIAHAPASSIESAESLCGWDCDFYAAELQMSQ